MSNKTLLADSYAASSSSTSTSSSANNVIISSSRPRYTYYLSSNRVTFGQEYHLLDVDVVDKSSNDSEYRRQKLPGYEHQRVIISQAFQAQATQNTQAAQTTPIIKHNAITQTLSQTLTAQEIQLALNSSALTSFLHHVYPLINSELAKNSVLDLFKDELQVINEEEEEERENQHHANSTGNNNTANGRSSSTSMTPDSSSAALSSSASSASLHHSSNANNPSSLSSSLFSSHAMSLFHSFHHLLLSKHHTVQHVEWHPTRACVAFSLTPNWSFDQWAEHSGEVSLSYIMLYDLGSLLHPYCIIKVPGLVTTFKFHPQQPAYIAAGLQTGQLILYQISNQKKQHKHALLNSSSTSNVATDNDNKSSNSNSGSDSSKMSNSNTSVLNNTTRSSSSFLSSLTSNGTDKSSSSLLPSPLYALLSNLDRSHGRPVTEIHWLPTSQQLNRKGDLLSSSARPISGHQYNNHNNTSNNNNTHNNNNNNSNNNQVASSSAHSISSQFVSLAADARLLYWDMIHLNEPATSLAQSYAINQSTVSSFTNTGSLDDGLFFNSYQHEQRDGKWGPIFTLPLTSSSAATSNSMDAQNDSNRNSDKISNNNHNNSSNDAQQNNASSQTNNDEHAAMMQSANTHVKVSTSFPVSTGITARKMATGPFNTWSSFTALTEDGEILEIDTSHRPIGIGRRCRVHASVGNSLERSLLLSNLYLSCGETTWALWQRGQDFPVFISPPCVLGTYSCARFSPTRPAVIGVARSDGVIEMWDCLDASHTPAYQFAVGTSDRVTDLSFQSTFLSQASFQAASSSSSSSVTGATPTSSVTSTKSLSISTTTHSSLPFLSSYSTTRQYLAAGDASGKCHIIEMPRPLRRKILNEETHMQTFINRETSRARYVQAREAVKRKGEAPHTPYQEQLLRNNDHNSLNVTSSTLNAAANSHDIEAETAYQALCKDLISA